METAVANNITAGEQPPAIEFAPSPPLDRERLLLAAIRARSAAAAGADDRDAQRPLDRQRFEFRIRLGCNILDQTAPGSAEARYDPQERRVQLRAAPDLALGTPPIAAIAGPDVEVVEGFWIRHPWLLTPACTNISPDGPNFGIAQFFTEQDPRTGRRGGRPYEIAAPLAEGADAPAPGGWVLVLRGRLRKWRDDRVILCRPAAEGVVPTCVISVEFDEVAVEEVESGRALAQWSRG